jgi:hypothetical protein
VKRRKYDEREHVEARVLVDFGLKHSSELERAGMISVAHLFPAIKISLHFVISFLKI